MIKLVPTPEPSDFVRLVKEPGERFLATQSRPLKSGDWKHRAYWTYVLPDLYESYAGICSYCAEWISQSTGDPTIDHFIPKSLSPSSAYEWSNFRLACLRFNRKKREYTDVLDPFAIETGWFILEFPSLQVLPNPTLESETKLKVEATIKRLGLQDPLSIKSKKRWVLPLCQGEISFDFLQRNAPFIASEIERQGILADLPQIMGLA